MRKARPASRLCLLFDGIGAAWVCFEPFMGSAREWSGRYSWECDAHCKRSMARRFPEVVHSDWVEGCTEARLRAILSGHAGDFGACVLSGGSPCQQLSRAGRSGESFAGKDSHLFPIRAGFQNTGKPFARPNKPFCCKSLKMWSPPGHETISKMSRVVGPSAPNHLNAAGLWLDA